jgi:L-rhamnose mutarotase
MSAMSATAPERVCFLMRLKPGRVADYLRAHEHVWPEMLTALSAAGWRNYSLFVDTDAGLVVGYFETDDYEAATQAMSATDVNDRWQTGMAEFFDGRPDEAMHLLAQYFHLA